MHSVWRHGRDCRWGWWDMVWRAPRPWRRRTSAESTPSDELVLVQCGICALTAGSVTSCSLLYGRRERVCQNWKGGNKTGLIDMVENNQRQHNGNPNLSTPHWLHARAGTRKNQSILNDTLTHEKRIAERKSTKLAKRRCGDGRGGCAAAQTWRRVRARARC